MNGKKGKNQLHVIKAEGIKSKSKETEICAICRVRGYRYIE